MELVSKLVMQVFIYILLGFIMSRLVSKNLEKFVDIFINFAIYFLIPFFILSTIWAAPLSVLEATKIISVAFFVFVAGILMAQVWAYSRKIPFSKHCLSIIFMNSAYLAIPINTMLWGKQGAVYTIIFSAVISVFNYTAGVWWISKNKSIVEVLKLPFIYAVVAGIGLNILAIPIPEVILKSGNYVSYFTLPLMLALVGYSLKAIKPEVLLDAFFAGVLLRMLGGVLAGTFFVFVFDVTSPTMAGVCLMTASMPPAANNYILAQRYKAEVEFTSASIFLGTVFVLLTVPAISYFLAMFY
ncbi:MAG: AEC family transporter [Elusimicrobia bacterium]|nr:AEC family transporter [Candidatus Liberimonas magnetica]